MTSSSVDLQDVKNQDASEIVKRFAEAGATWWLEFEPTLDVFARARPFEQNSQKTFWPRLLVVFAIRTEEKTK